MPILGRLFLGYALLQRHVSAVRLPDIPLPRVEARDVALGVEADPAQHRAELAAVHGLDHGIEVQRARRTHRLSPDLNRGVGVQRESRRIVTLCANRATSSAAWELVRMSAAAIMSVPPSPAP